MNYEIFNLKNLYFAYKDCKKRKSNTHSHLQFAEKLEKNLIQLKEELILRKYEVGKFICFIDTEPVIREIFAGEFCDRIVHHLLVNEIEKYFEPKFIYDSFSCRKGKGIHKGVKRLQSGIQSLEDKTGKKSYFLQLDISGFFMNISRKILFEILEKEILKISKKFKKSKIWKEEIFFLLEKIIFTDPTKNFVKKGQLSLFDLVPKNKSLFGSDGDKGLPIGNLTSQFFANVYLNKFDHFIKRDLKFQYYYRYVDDFVILDSDPEKLKNSVKIIDNFLQENLKLSLNHKKTKFQTCDKGIDFLGYIVRKKYLLVRKRVVKNFQRKINNLFLKNRYAIYNSYLGHLKHAKSFNLIMKLMKLK